MSGSAIEIDIYDNSFKVFNSMPFRSDQSLVCITADVTASLSSDALVTGL